MIIHRATCLQESSLTRIAVANAVNQAEMLKLLILKTATEMDGMTQREIERDLGDKVSMCNVCTCGEGWWLELSETVLG